MILTEGERIHREVVQELIEAAQQWIDFHAMDTQEFVAKYGHGVTTKDCANRARAAIANAKALDLV